MGALTLTLVAALFAFVYGSFKYDEHKRREKQWKQINGE